MKCKICGGNLLLQGNLYVCENCQNKFALSTVYESSDVFIAYPETDSQGRRTKESIISQEIYNRLQTSNINTFYQRISADKESGFNLEAICDYAISNAKIIIIVATNSNSFQIIVNKYKKSFSNKILLPVYADMDAHNLPEELEKFQALNYNAVGSANDLVKIVLHKLGRDNELDIIDLSNKKSRRKQKIALISILFVVILFFSVLLYFIFGTAYVLPNKKYENAQQLLDENKYVEAIERFSEIYDYKDSSDQIKKIYNQYIGYYSDQENNIALHLDITDNIEATVEIRKYSDNGNILINETSEMDGNKISVSYNDSENNQGKAEIILQDNGIELNINTETNTNDYSFEKTTIFFDLTNKSDKPLTKEVTADTIKKWLSKRYTESQIINEGFELTLRASYNKGLSWVSYKISNTDVIVDFFNNELSYTKLGNTFDKNIALLYTVPAKIIIPDKIGEKCEPFIDGNNAFFPNKGFSYYDHRIGWSFDVYDDINIIEDDTPVLCTSKALVDEEFIKEVVDNY